MVTAADSRRACFSYYGNRSTQSIQLNCLFTLHDQRATKVSQLAAAVACSKGNKVDRGGGKGLDGEMNVHSSVILPHKL